MRVSLLNSGTFALIVLIGSGLLAIAAAWLLKEKLGIGIPKLAQPPLLGLLAYIVFRVVLQPPIPFSLLVPYMTITLVAILLYLSLTEESWQEFIRPVRRFLEKEPTVWEWRRVVVLSTFPFFAGFATFYLISPQDPPLENIEGLRTAHGAPPQTIDIGGEQVSLWEMRNPFQVDDGGAYSTTVQREEAKGNPWGAHPSRYLTYIREGGEIYFRECVFCHGANLDSRAIFADAFRPIPANLRAIAKVLNPLEGDTFFRVYKGGPAQPWESWPWSSSMPPWEKFLTVDEVWKVILYEYWEANYAPWYKESDKVR